MKIRVLRRIQAKRGARSGRVAFHRAFRKALPSIVDNITHNNAFYQLLRRRGCFVSSGNSPKDAYARWLNLKRETDANQP